MKLKIRHLNSINYFHTIILILKTNKTIKINLENKNTPKAIAANQMKKQKPEMDFEMEEGNYEMQIQIASPTNKYLNKCDVDMTPTREENNQDA